MTEHSGDCGAIAKLWFDVMRRCGSDVRELLHDGAPTVRGSDAGFAYVTPSKAHVNVGFFRERRSRTPRASWKATVGSCAT